MSKRKRNRITPKMSQTIADTSPLVKKSQIFANQNEINNNDTMEVSLKNLQNNPYQPRIDINLHGLNELITSIEKNGLLQPIIITEANDEGIHTIIAGHRRYEAHKLMSKNSIKAIILKNIEKKDLAILSLTENIIREDLHPIENAIAMKNILDNKIVESQNKLAEYIGLSKGYVSKLMNILNLPESLIKTIKEDNYKDVSILVLLNKIENEEDINHTYQDIRHMLRAEAEKYIKNKYFNKNINSVQPIEIKNNKSKISINIDLKQLSSEKKEIINKKIAALNEDILSLIKE